MRFKVDFLFLIENINETHEFSNTINAGIYAAIRIANPPIAAIPLNVNISSPAFSGVLPLGF